MKSRVVQMNVMRPLAIMSCHEWRDAHDASCRYVMLANVVLFIAEILG